MGLTVFNDILGPIVAILGILGNISCLLAIWHRNRTCSKNQEGMKGYMYTFLCGLAVADLGYLAFMLQVFNFSSSVEIECNNLKYRDQVLVPICNSFKAASDFIVIFMTINRCRVMGNITEMRISVLRKEAANERLSWNAFFQILAAFAISFVLHLPFYFYNFLDEYSPCTIADNEGDYDGHMWFLYYVICVTLVNTMPIFLIVTLNVVLIKRLRVMATRRRRLQSERSINQDVNENRRAWSVHNKTSIQEQKLTILLVIIAVSYFFFTLPGNVSFILFNLPDNIGDEIKNLHDPLSFITNFLESLNYAANFYIYCAVHEELRGSFLDMCKSVGDFITCG